MASKAAPYRCSECGHAALAWTGQCPGCGAWNTLEQASSPSPGRRGGGGAGRGRAPKPVALRDVKAERSERLSTGIAELDRVLGGGLVPGSLVLLGGAPGIGKSTLAGMALANLAGSGEDTLYVSGEESAAQVRRRAERLGDAALSVPMLAEPSLESVLAALEAERPAACVIDSVQTLAVPDTAPGSVGAVREATSALLDTIRFRPTTSSAPRLKRSWALLRWCSRPSSWRWRWCRSGTPPWQPLACWSRPRRHPQFSSGFAPKRAAACSGAGKRPRASPL